MHQRRPLAAAAMSDRLSKAIKAVENIDSIDLANKQPGKVREGAGDAGAGSLDIGWNGDGIAVVLDDKEYGKLVQRSGADRLVKISLARSSISGGDVDHLVLATGRQRRVRRQAPDNFIHLCSTDRLQELGSRGAGLADDIQFGSGEVVRHLTTAGAGIRPLAQGLPEKVCRGHSEAIGEGTITVIGIEPVLTRAQQLRRYRLDGLVSRTAELKLKGALTPQAYLRFVQLARPDHEIVDPEQVFLLHGS